MIRLVVKRLVLREVINGRHLHLLILLCNSPRIYLKMVNWVNANFKINGYNHIRQGNIQAKKKEH